MGVSFPLSRNLHEGGLKLQKSPLIIGMKAFLLFLYNVKNYTKIVKIINIKYTIYTNYKKTIDFLVKIVYTINRNYFVNIKNTEYKENKKYIVNKIYIVYILRERGGI